ncbi:hypothetical protein BZG00_15605 [Salinivibrio kushneri]|uniref:Uncharacterized protein n=2 Tax=Pseudomonadota TaxID=1224 RepID=A0A922NZM2_9HYPH|nr:MULTISPECIES: hypothetical protein [Pseudomonadota]YP_008125988.1 hypothetical protein M610_gp017 [Alteromonas phage vB_AmaP_AD45-P1]AGM46954.1 hypothetical protein AD45P3_00080 [Alteromonas phage vB_AmaP_AD45-P3]AGM47071.1 hypothetical protein AD45P4_00080 [Alteromonas phage vB_AmaP_AD45-P4]AGM47187.1 hypothetical protein AD45P2_00080 [Alteromonas phage vB_AmaP_AD45-P2]AGM46835.1 hypothetical protein AD45P1_00085 [Alteromonas phage vB_AmaP_AD45-P1]KEQ05574.1 hypothetical protein GV68_0857
MEDQANTQAQQAEATVTIDDTVYAVKDLSDEAKYTLQLIEDLRQQMGATRARFDQLSMAEQGFTQKLREEVAKADKKTKKSKKD